MMKNNFKSGGGSAGGAGGFGADMQWLVYNFPLGEVKDFDTFKPTPYFMKTYVAFFSQYAQVILLASILKASFANVIVGV